MKTIKKYIVSVGYREFEFDAAAGTRALDFAIISAKTLVIEGNINNEVKITLVVEAEQEAANVDLP